METSTLQIKVIAGSTREGRFSDTAARWIAGVIEKQPGVMVEVLDLRDYDMPFFDAPVPPSMKSTPYAHPAVAAWTQKIKEADAFVMVTPEYNHATSGVLKNAIDWVYEEWHNKPVAFVSYGSAGGARAVENLRLIAGELQMADIRNAVLIPGAQYFPAVTGKASVEEMFASLSKHAEGLATQLVWWARALAAARSAPRA